MGNIQSPSGASNVGKLVKLKAKLPKVDEGFNGLQDIAGDVLDDQHRTHVLVMIVSCDEVNIRDYGDIEEARVSIAHIEAVVDPAQERVIRDLLKQRQQERTGGIIEPMFGADS